MMDLRRITIFGFILLFIVFLGSKYAFTEDEKTVTIHTPQRQIAKELLEPNKTVFQQTQVEHLAVIKQEESLQQIKEKYKNKFEQLQTETNQQIDSLVETALNDFRTYINKENNNDSLKTLYQKYASEGQKIEQQTEKEFQILYKELIDELVENGYNEAEAEEFQLIYEQQKEELKSEIVKKAMSVVRN